MGSIETYRFCQKELSKILECSSVWCSKLELFVLAWSGVNVTSTLALLIVLFKLLFECGQNLNKILEIVSTQLRVAESVCETCSKIYIIYNIAIKNFEDNLSNQAVLSQRCHFVSCVVHVSI